MRVVTFKELSNFKILPFDLYDETNTRIILAGEILTPGKIIMLKNYSQLYTEDVVFDERQEHIQTAVSKNGLKKLINYSFDSLDSSNFETVINKENVLDTDIQIKLKYYMHKSINLLQKGYYKEAIVKFNQLSDIMITNVLKYLFSSQRGSQVRFLGEYEICHPLNTAIISGLIAKKLEYANTAIKQLVLAALIHDIGKFKLQIGDESAILTPNETLVAEHTTIGYDLIKNELGLDEQIALVALEHHENNDGSGYPKGLSSDYISELAQIVNVASYYDNLACNRTATNVSNNRDALRAMLESGTKRFSAKILYMFVHMFNYDDHEDFTDMML